jgi:hypothetical protein
LSFQLNANRKSIDEVSNSDLWICHQ